jgi:hypothetical protein
VSGGERADRHDVDIVLDGLTGGFLGLLEERADVDIEAEIGEAVATTLAPRSWPS